MKTFAQYYEYFTSKIEKRFLEKTFIYPEGVSLRYILKIAKKSDKLIVILSACTRKGIKARYNYMRTLSHCDENQLYILDDFGFDRRGAYYLGSGGNEIEETCIKLITRTIEQLKPKKVFFCGSSKGGWAALDFMPSFDDSIAIVGAPQYKLGDYLMKPPNEVTLKYVLPEQTEEAVANLNNHLRERLLRSGQHKVYLHYSDNEHTYNEHIVFLLRDLLDSGYQLETEKLHYTDHWDVGKYFPAWMTASLKREGCTFRE